jgi:hypothetical protein
MGVTEESNPTAPATRARCKRHGPSELFQYSLDFKGDLEKAFDLWDAVVAGTKVASDDMLGGKEERVIWGEVDAFVQAHR